jgi:hypothetical protein
MVSLYLVEEGGLLRTFLYFALRARLRRFKFVPDKFVEPTVNLGGSHPLSAAATPRASIYTIIHINSYMSGGGRIRTSEG